MEVVRQRRGGGEWAVGPAAPLGPDTCPLLPLGMPCQRPLHRRRSTAEPGLEPAPRRAQPQILLSYHGHREEKASLQTPVSESARWGFPTSRDTPPPQGRKPWSLFQKPNLHASTSRARPVECLLWDERPQEGPRDFPTAPPAFPHSASAWQMLRMGMLSLTHQPPRGLWDAGPSVMDKGRRELAGRTDGHKQTRPPPPSPGLP